MLPTSMGCKHLGCIHSSLDDWMNLFRFGFNGRNFLSFGIGSGSLVRQPSRLPLGLMFTFKLGQLPFVNTGCCSCSWDVPGTGSSPG